jgi:selenocysteine lyase/cysteine desulfurase
MNRAQAYERTLSERLIPGMLSIHGVWIYGITNPLDFGRRAPTVSFVVEGRDPLEVAEALGARGIFSWAGQHYALEPMSRLELQSTNRIGLVHYNTSEEIDIFLEVLEEIVAA